MKIAKLIAIIGIIAMTAVLVNGFVDGNFSQDGAELLANPWGIVSFVDLYVGFTLFSIWIAFREKNILAAIIWIVLMMGLGFFTGSLYLLIALIRSKGDWLSFFLGDRKDQILTKIGKE
ncbi:DUF1475 family protein [Chloroflexota bacterium]|nr:DUF1475 family protein [Chloroflexota bacterium]